MDVRATQSVVRISSTTNTNSCGLVFNNFAGDFWIGRDSSAGNGFGMASPAYAGVINARGNYPLYIGRNDSNDISIFTTGNIGINTTTDAGFRLDVNGTARVSGALTVTSEILMTTSTQSLSLWRQNYGNTLRSRTGNGSGRIYGNFTGGLANADQFFINVGYDRTSTTAGTADGSSKRVAEICLSGVDSTSSNHFIGFNVGVTNPSEVARITGATGNLLINTTTDAGFRLDVNGTARVSGGVTLTDSSAGIGGSAQGVSISSTYWTDFFYGGTRTHRLASNQFGLNSFIGNNIAIGYNPTGASPASAKIELGAGTATAGTAPLKLRAGTNLTTPENGAFEYDGTNLYFTVGGVRKTVVLL
jgi:hypothetical protein